MVMSLLSVFWLHSLNLVSLHLLTITYLTYLTYLKQSLPLFIRAVPRILPQLVAIKATNTSIIIIIWSCIPVRHIRLASSSWSSALIRYSTSCLHISNFHRNNTVVYSCTSTAGWGD